MNAKKKFLKNFHFYENFFKTSFVFERLSRVQPLKDEAKEKEKNQIIIVYTSGQYHKHFTIVIYNGKQSTVNKSLDGSMYPR